MNISNSVVLVTVTYGNRIDLVSKLVSTVLGNPSVSSIVLVDNGSSSDLSPLTEEYGARVDIIDMGRNTGSAVAYAAGIERALATTAAPYIWLMDDDNVPVQGALEILLEILSQGSSSPVGEVDGVFGYRESHQAAISSGASTHRRSSFLGFHVLDVPGKLADRLTGRTKRHSPAHKLLEVPFGPYGGLLVRREVLRRIGLPMSELVLYADDSEYTSRITASGGRLMIATSAVLEDLELSWNVATPKLGAVRGLLAGEGDFRAYYSVRNRVWFDWNKGADSRLLFVANAVLYTFIISACGVRFGKLKRTRLLLTAIAHGLAGRLGVNRAYPL